MASRTGPRPGRSATGDAGVSHGEVILVLSLATDVARGQPMGAGMRACLLALRLADELAVDSATMSDVYYLALLRFAGCTAASHVTAEVFGDDVAFHAAALRIDHTNPAAMLRFVLGRVGSGRPPLDRARDFAGKLPIIAREASHVTRAECEVAQGLARRLSMPPEIQTAVGQAFERWDGKGRPRRLKGDEIARAMRIVQLAHDAELFHRLGGVEAVVEVARARSGGAYDPRIVERFCQGADTLCASLDEDASWDALLAAEPASRPRLVDGALDEAIGCMADFTDLKSCYTPGHSRGVAALAGAAAERCGLAATDVARVRRAGYVHDLGRAAVSSAIWIKEGPLSESEWEQVRLHPYYTERLLARSSALAPLGALGALHHERLDGSGYHRALPGAMLSPAARILAAADAYHAMTEPRPHRPALAPDAAARELRSAARAGTLDGDAVHAVLTAAGRRVGAVRRDRVGGLSDREIEVLRLLVRGATYRDLARALQITPKTAEHHVSHIYAKIGVSTRAAATLFAMEHDLVAPDRLV